MKILKKALKTEIIITVSKPVCGFRHGTDFLRWDG